MYDSLGQMPMGAGSCVVIDIGFGSAPSSMLRSQDFPVLSYLHCHKISMVFVELHLSRLEQQHGNLAKVKVDEVLGFVSDVAAKVSTHDAMPGGVVLPVKLLLDVGGNVLFHVELLHGLGCALNGVLLDIFGHVGILDYCFAFRHSDDCCISAGTKEETKVVKKNAEYFLRCHFSCRIFEGF